MCGGSHSGQRGPIFHRPCARCEDPGEHSVCAACVTECGLGKALMEGVGPPGTSTMGWNICPDAERVARELMGEDDSPVSVEPECPECGPTEWICAMIKNVCAMCGADYPEGVSA